MLLSEGLWTIHIFSWAAGGQIPWCTMLLSLVWRVYEKISQNEQMDFIVRYWDSDTGQDSVRYIGSEFLGHVTAADLLTHFKDGIRELDPKRLLHGCTQWVWTGSSTLFWHENAKLRNSRTYEHRQLKSHGNSFNCHGKVMELYYQISVGTL